MAQQKLSASELNGIIARFRVMVEYLGSQAYAAKTACVSVGSIKGYLGAGGRAPSFTVVARLACASGFSIDWIATGKGPRLRKAQPQAVTKERPVTTDCIVIRCVHEEGGWRVRAVRNRDDILPCDAFTSDIDNDQVRCDRRRGHTGPHRGSNLNGQMQWPNGKDPL